MVRAAVEREMRELRARDAVLADGALAATALALADQLDDLGVSATAKAACARSLSDILAQLRELAPREVKGDKLDELTKRRKTRVAGSSAA